MSSKFLKLSILISCFCVALVMRASNYEFVLQNFTGHLNYIDTDCWYYLRRLVHFVENFPQIMLFDPLVDWPNGSFVDWPEGFLLLLGIPLKLMGVHDFRTLETGVSLLMMLLGLGCCVVAVLACQRIFQNIYFSMIALFLAATNFLLVRFSCLGEVDHHIVEALVAPFIFVLADISYRDRKIGAAFGLSAFLALSLMVSSSSLFAMAAYFIVYVLVYGKPENLRLFLSISIGACLFLLPYVLWSTAIRGAIADQAHPSYFHLSLILACSAGAALLVRSKLNLKVILSFFIVVGVAYFFRWPSLIFDPIQVALDYVFGKSGILKNVSEAAPIYLSQQHFSVDYMHLSFGFLVWLLPGIWLSLIFWKKISQAERGFLIMASVMSIPGIAQKRFAHLMILFFIIFLTWLVYRLSLVKTKALQVVTPFAAGLVVLGSILPLFLYGFAPMGSPRDRVDLGSLQQFLKTAHINEQDAWNRLAGKLPVTEGVWANPNMGHLILYLTGYAVVTNSFYHPQAFDLDFLLRTQKTDEELRSQLRKNRIRYALLADDFIFMDMQFQLRGITDKNLIKYENKEGRRVPMVNLEKAQEYAWARFVTQEWAPAGFENLFRIRFNEAHFYNFVRGLKFTEF